MPFVERDGVQIHYRDEGAGFPVVLHTGGAGDGTMWDGAGYTARLAGFRLLIVDHRGRGRSGRVSTLAGHRPVEYVADVIAVADAVGAVEFAFAGYSMGASVGYGLAAAHPGRISALVAIGGVADEPGADDGTTELIDLLERGGAPALTRAIEEGEGITLPGWLRRNFDETDAAQFVLSLRAWAAEGDTTWNDLAGIEVSDRARRRAPTSRRPDPSSECRPPSQEGPRSRGSRVAVTSGRSSTRRRCCAPRCPCSAGVARRRAR